jgi:hypothetical protein
MNEYPMHINKSNSITDSKVLTKYIWAFTLGDGCLYVANRKNRPNLNMNASFECNQVLETEEYSLWRADILSNITPVNLYLKTKHEREYLDAHEQSKITPESTQISTKTNTHPMFTTIRNRMYLNGHKVIDPHYLKLLDWETLAIFYQDDGSLSIKSVREKYQYWTVALSTEGFSYGDNILLQRAIKDKFDILFRLVGHPNKNGELHYRLQLQRQNEVDIFLNGVEKFIKPCFQYKIRKTFVRCAPDENQDGVLV